MEHLIVPENYEPAIGLRETQVAIKIIKDFFQRELAKQLNLTRDSAPLFVLPESGLNDNLNGVERPDSFGIKEGPAGGDCSFTGKVEENGSEAVWLSARRRPLHRHERDPQRRGHG